MEGRVETLITDGVARITFHHPQSNSLPGDLLRKIAAEIKAAGENENAKVII